MTTLDPSRPLGTVKDRFHRVLIGYAVDGNALTQPARRELAHESAECRGGLHGGMQIPRPVKRNSCGSSHELDRRMGSECRYPSYDKAIS